MPRNSLAREQPVAAVGSRGWDSSSGQAVPDPSRVAPSHAAAVSRVTWTRGVSRGLVTLGAPEVQLREPRPDSPAAAVPTQPEPRPGAQRQGRGRSEAEPARPAPCAQGQRGRGHESSRASPSRGASGALRCSQPSCC